MHRLASANQASSSYVTGNMDLARKKVTLLGWSASCSCPSHEPVPATVLDPFGGRRHHRPCRGSPRPQRHPDRIESRLRGHGTNPARSGCRHVRLSGGRGMSLVAVAEPQTAEELYALYKRVLARRYNPPIRPKKVILALVPLALPGWSTARAGTNTRKAGPEPKQPSTRSAISAGAAMPSLSSRW
jgi:hypothetical protein